MGFFKDVWNATAGVVTGDSAKFEKGLTGIASLTGDLLNRATGSTQANQWQWDMWKEQNAYNTPESQMERLKAAGLNPMLVYGNGSVVGNTAGSMSAASPAGSGALGAAGAVLKSPFGIAKMSQDLQLGQAQIEQAEANTAAALQSVLNMQSNAKKVDAETSSVLYNLGLAQKLGVRDGSFTTLELGRTYGRRVKDLARDVFYGHPSGKNSLIDQLKRFFE